MSQRETYLRKKVEWAESKGYVVSSIKALTEYLKLYPKSTYNLYRLSENFRAIGRYSEAARILLKLKDASIPKKFAYLVSLNEAMIHQDKGQYAAARKKYKEAILAGSEISVPYVFFASFLLKSGKANVALLVLKEALKRKVSGDIDEIYLNAGHCCRAMNDLDQAKLFYELALKEFPKYTHARVALNDLDCGTVDAP